MLRNGSMSGTDSVTMSVLEDTLALGPRATSGIISVSIAVTHRDMARSLIWISGDAIGWACSNCRWKFPVPTLLTGEEAKGAYDRLAAAKFREHQCEAESSFSTANQEPRPKSDTAFADRARELIKRGYTPKVAVELVIHEVAFEHGNDPRILEKARAEAEDFLLRARRGLI